MEYNYDKYFEKYNKQLNLDKPKALNLKKDISFKNDTFFDILQKKQSKKTSKQSQAITLFLICEIIPQIQWFNSVGETKLQFRIPQELVLENINNANNTIIDYFKNENIYVQRKGFSPYTFLVRWDKPYHSINKRKKTSLMESKKVIKNLLNHDLLYTKLKATFNEFNIEDIDKYKRFLYTTILPELESKSEKKLKHIAINIPKEFKNKYSIRIIIHLLEEQNLYTYKRFISNSKLHIKLNRSYTEITTKIDKLNYKIMEELDNASWDLIDVSNKYVQQIINLIVTLIIRTRY